MAPSQIFLTTVSGGTKVLRDIETIQDLHTAAKAAHPDLEADDLHLSFASRPLYEEDSATLEQLGICDDSTVTAEARLLGGGKKRKKKTYTKPKKIKHKHKTVKLAVLNYYKIGSDGTLERLRKECSHPMCGAGVFYASHADRLYCGKCGLTYVKDN